MGLHSLFRYYVPVMALMILPPLAGVWLSGRPLARYLEFPPRTVYVQHAPFSVSVFVCAAVLSVVVLCCILSLPLWFRGRPGERQAVPASKGPTRRLLAARRLIVAGPVVITIAWILAWTDFVDATLLKTSTFTCLWIGYILLVNGIVLRRTGQCRMFRRPWQFAALFAASAVFWWYFEYLNRFTQNWLYMGAGELRPWTYILLATPPFATVLPAVMSTADLLRSGHRLDRHWRRLRPLPSLGRRSLWISLLVASVLMLAAVPVFPNFLFPLLWGSPLLIITASEALAGRRTVFRGLRYGDWRMIVSLAAGALVCGFFWEMWNFYSAAKWVYLIPYVDAYRIFEMPVLGYGGYLPFGLECYAIARFFKLT